MKSQIQYRMWGILLNLMLLAVNSFEVPGIAECTETLLYRCQADINKGIADCEMANEAKGKDPDADLQCIKYLVDTERDCWPCICKVADVRKIKVKGCPQKQ